MAKKIKTSSLVFILLIVCVYYKGINDPEIKQKEYLSEAIEKGSSLFCMGKGY